MWQSFAHSQEYVSTMRAEDLQIGMVYDAEIRDCCVSMDVVVGQFLGYGEDITPNYEEYAELHFSSTIITTYDAVEFIECTPGN